MPDFVMLLLAVALGYFLRGEWSRQRAFEQSLERIEGKLDAISEMFTDPGSGDSDHGLPS